MSPIREQMIGITASIVLIFLLTGATALYCLLYVSPVWATVALGAQLVAVPAVALTGYAHGRAMVGPVHSSDTISNLLLVSTLLGIVLAVSGLLVLARRAGLANL